MGDGSHNSSSALSGTPTLFLFVTPVRYVGGSSSGSSHRLAQEDANSCSSSVRQGARRTNLRGGVRRPLRATPLDNGTNLHEGEHGGQNLWPSSGLTWVWRC